MTTILAATTTDNTLSVVDITLLKRGPSSISSCLDLVEAPVASCWSPDNASLFIASAKTIYSYEPTSNVLREIYAAARDGSDAIGSLAVKDKNTVVFSVGRHVHVLDCCSQPTTITHTFDSHKVAVEFLSLSNDNTLLASTSAGPAAAVHIHNLASRSHVVLRGLSTNIDSVLFHAHSRTRLLVATTRQILIYDTNRPSAPTKVMPLSESAPGNIIAAACSPYSKTLVAVATSQGFVVMMDLEREKAQVRTINLKSSLTTLEFSPEGGAIYAGSANGKLLIVDLRSLDKPPRTIVVNEAGHPVRTTNIQKKLPLNNDVVTKTPKANSAITLRTPSEPPPLPALRRTASAAGSSSATKSAAVSKGMGSPFLRKGKAVPPIIPPVPQRPPPSALRDEEVRTESPPAAAEDPKRNVLSPAKDPLGNSIGTKRLVQQPETKGRKKLSVTPVKPKKASSDSIVKPQQPTPSPRPSPSLGSSLTRAADDGSDGKGGGVRRSRTLPTTIKKGPTTKKSDTPSEEKKKKPSIPGTERLGVPSNITSAPQRRVDRTASRAGLLVPPSSDGPASMVSSSSAGRGRGRSGSTSGAGSPSISRANAAEAVAVLATKKKAATDTPSPDLPDEPEPITPLKQQQKKKSTGLQVLGLGTPEVEMWIRAGQGEGDDDDDDDDDGEEEELGGRDAKGKRKTVGFHIDENPIYVELEKERRLALKVSPHRRVPGSGSGLIPSTSSSTVDSWAALVSNSPALSLASGPDAGPGPVSGAGAGNLTSSTGGLPPTHAHDLLKTIVQDVMFDFQRDTKAEMMGLHLDLLRMGRSWKVELRVLMDEYVGDLRELRDENERLRKENERLRRGWE